MFNFENGCYAKVIQLSPTAEPEIYAATRRFGTVLENVVYDPVTRYIDLDDDAITENTRLVPAGVHRERDPPRWAGTPRTSSS